MSEVTRTRLGVEKLELRKCPCCGGNVDAVECGYTSFNPGSAHCRGECKRIWDLGFVDSKWSCGVRWNRTADSIAKKLRAFRLISVNKKLTISRDYAEEELQEEASHLLKLLEETIIGATTKPKSIERR